MGYNAPTNTYDTFADLRLATGQSSSSVTVLGKMSPFDGLGGTFTFYSTSTESDDDFSIIQPLTLSSGRWYRVTSGMPFSETVVFSGNGSQTTFEVTYNYSIEFLHNNYQVMLTPLTPDAFGKWNIIKTNNGFSITYDVAPPSGTGNIQIDYLIRHTFII